jgi:hypothetical protein
VAIPVPLALAISEWLDGYYTGSERTRRAYRDAVEGMLLPFLSAQNVINVHDVTPALLTAFMRHLAGRPRTTTRPQRPECPEARPEPATTAGDHAV